MKIKNVNLQWYVMNWDTNHNKPYAINIMSLLDLNDISKKLKHKGNKPTEYNSIKTWYELRNYLKKEFMFHTWSKCEYEMIVSSLPNPKNEDGIKVDVWSQIAPNLNEITNYLIIKTDIKSIKPINNPKDNKDINFGLSKQ